MQRIVRVSSYNCQSIASIISYPDLPRPREREISLFSVKQSEIWVRDYCLDHFPSTHFTHKAQRGKKKTLGINNRLQNSPYFCVFKYARVVKQKVWDEAENRERDWGETRGALRACKTLTPRLTDFFTDFEEKTDCFAV